MTTILAVDASTELCSVALLRDGNLFEKVSDTPRSHANRLLPMIDEILVESDIGLKQLDAIAFGAGPGSFTGLRICVGIVQGLAFGARLPVIAVSSLEAMAFAAWQRYSKFRYFIPAIDARMGEIYWATYAFSDGKPEVVTAPQVISVPLLDAGVLTGLTPDDAVGVGSGWGLLHQSRAMLSQCKEDFWPQAAAVASLAGDAFLMGACTDAKSAEPIYLRTEISWKKRQRIRPDC